MSVEKKDLEGRYRQVDAFIEDNPLTHIGNVVKCYDIPYYSNVDKCLSGKEAHYYKGQRICYTCGVAYRNQDGTLEKMEYIDYKNIEIIVINDGSTDKTSEILKKYQNYNFKIIEQENSGVSQARNTGLKTATGDYIMFLDADDIINNDS